MRENVVLQQEEQSTDITERPMRPRKIPSRFKDYESEYSKKKNKKESQEDAGVNLIHTDLDNLNYYSPDYQVSLNNVMKVEEPRTYREAALKEEWVNAMEEEIAAIEKNETWEITDLPEGHKAIDTKWVYKINQARRKR